MVKREKRKTVDVEVTEKEWERFRVAVLRKGKTVRGVVTEFVRNYGKRVSRETERTEKVEHEKAEG